jgi:hypothetical protein
MNKFLWSRPIVKLRLSFMDDLNIEFRDQLYKTLIVSSWHFYPSLIFVGKARSLPLEWSPIWTPTPSLARKFLIIDKIVGRDKRSSL